MQKSSVALVLAGHVSQAHISWLSSDLHLPIWIQHLSKHPYIRSSVLSAVFALLNSKLPSSIPNSSSVNQDTAVWFSFESDKFKNVYIKLLNFNKSARSSLPRTEPYCKSKLYANCQPSLTIVIVPLLWQLLNYGMICLCPLGRPIHCLYFNRLLKHIFS